MKMNVKNILAGAGIAGALSFGALGMGAGLAHGDNDYPYPPPVPGHDWHGDNWHNWGAGWRDDPGRWHDRDDFGDFRAPYDLGFVPDWAPTMPPVPDWAPGAQVVWNPGVAGWGVWWGGNFVPL
jgi:hypothetical protein